jgi:hypothetical protein
MSTKPTRGGILGYAGAIAIMFAGALGFTQYLSAADIQLQKKPIEAPGGLKFHTLPGELPPSDPRWRDTGRAESMSKEVIEELGTENFVTRWYAQTDAPEGERPHLVQLHAAYYTGMIDTVPHVPERCFVGGGLRTVAGSTKQVRVPLDMSRLVPDLAYERAQREAGVPEDEIDRIWMGRSAEVHSRVRLPRGVENLKMNVTEFSDGSKNRIFAGYFFLTNGEAVPTAEQVRAKGFALTQDYVYYAKVQFLTSGIESAEELASIAGDMLDELLPEIMRRCPDWIEVEAGRYPPEASEDNGRS